VGGGGVVGAQPGLVDGQGALVLVHAMVAGGDRIDDVGLLRSGVDRQRARRSGGGALQVGRWLRSFTFGQVRQLDKLTGELLARAWAAGVAPSNGTLSRSVRSERDSSRILTC
jgi:hypothetical protein